MAQTPTDPKFVFSACDIQTGSFAASNQCGEIQFTVARNELCNPKMGDCIGIVHKQGSEPSVDLLPVFYYKVIGLYPAYANMLHILVVPT